MDIGKVRELVKLVEDSGIEELEVAHGDTTIRIQKSPPLTMAAACVGPSTLPPLNAVRTLPGGYQSESSVITSVARLGLDQRENLGGEAKVVYRDLLRTLFLPRLVLHVEERVEDETASLDDLYASLRTYVMLGDPEHFSADSVEQWLAADLESEPAAGDTGQEALDAQIRVLH